MLYFFHKNKLFEKITNDFFFTKLFIVSTKLTTMASYGTRIKWKKNFCSHPIHSSWWVLVHPRLVSLLTLLLASLPLNHQMYTSSHLPWTSLSLFPSKESHWKHKVTWIVMGTISILRNTKKNQLWANFGAFGGLIWKFGNFHIFCDDIIYTS
jgi:hypothetical protein